MKKHIRLKVASPCPENWDEMKGGDARRFCGKCEKDVYQLSEMTSSEIEALLEQPGVCARFFQRADGTVMTSDCGPGRRKRRRKQAVLGFGAGLLSMAALAAQETTSPAMGEVAPLLEQIQPLMGEAVELPPKPTEVTPEPAHIIMGRVAPPQGEYLMGDVAFEEVDAVGDPANDNAPPETE